MSPRLVFIESASDMGGVEFSTLYLASHLDPSLWTTLVICPGEGKLASACRDIGVQVEIVPIPRLLSTSFRAGKTDTRLPNFLSWFWNGFAILIAANRLRKFLSQNVADLVVTKGIYAHFCGGLAAKIVGIKCIWHVQDFISERYGGLYQVVFGLLAAILPQGIVVDGTAIARQLPPRIQNRASIILNGIDTQVFRPGIDGSIVRNQFGFYADNVVIGHAARITHWKGQHHLLEAFGTISSSYPKARLFFVGAPTFDDDTYEKKLRSRVEELGLSNQVIFAGFRADLPQVLAAMDVFAYPSVEKDTSPLALLSAMGCGLPIVAFDIDGVREVLGSIGILIPVRNEQKLANALEKLVQDAEIRKQMGLQCREKAVAEFSLERYVADMQENFMRD